MSAEGSSPPQYGANSAQGSASASIPTSVRLAFEIQKPKDWQAFQRNCVVLFREELRDPHAMEYGRNGQKQHGIDIKANRDGHPAHVVGIQCRRYDSPLKYKAMLQDCRDAAKHFKNLKEFIFATTSPDDRALTDEVARVEEQLAKDGYSVRVVLYGWEALQQVIARHPPAYELFSPGLQTAPAPTAKVALDDALASGAIDAVAERLAELLGPRSPGAAPRLPAVEPENLPQNAASEDPALHGRIDAYRDILSKDGQPELARKGLLALKASTGLDDKPWARYRIEANLGSVEYHLGNEDEAVALFESAYALRPNDPTAQAHLSLARLLKGRYEEAMSLAQEALAGIPKPEPALTCLIQAAVLSGSETDPETLIPEDMKNTVGADLGLAEAYRQRRVPDWQTRCIELARRHPGIREFVPVNAVAVLSLAVESQATVPGGVGPVSADDIGKAADDMLAFVGHLLEIGYADLENLRAHLNNTCVLLRLCGRNADVEALLKRAPASALQDPVLRLQLGVALAGQDRASEAISLLAADDDPENRTFRLSLLTATDPSAALDGALAMEAGGLPPRLAWQRWSLVAEMGLKTGRLDVLPAAISALREIDADDPAPAVFDLRVRRTQGLGDDEFEEEFTRLARSLPAQAPMAHRCFLAVELRDAGLPEEASILLDGYVDLSRPLPTAVLYLKSLAEARRDAAFCGALNRSAPALRDLPEVLWATAAHAWNMGDLPRAEEVVGKLVEVAPDNLAARLFRIQILVRQNNIPAVEQEVERPLEGMASKRLDDFLEVVALLSHFGHVERAAVLAYRLFIHNRDNPRVWMSLIGVVLGEGRTDAGRRDLWAASVVGTDIAVDVTFDDGTTGFFVIEPDIALRKLDADAWDPNHPFIRLIMGLPSGAEFADQGARKGTIKQLRHKVVARFHYVLAEYERRFPERQGFRSMKVAPNEPGGMDEVAAMLKARIDWVTEEQEKYNQGHWPLALLAARLGTDVIETAEGLVAQGFKLRTALGVDEDRDPAAAAIFANKRGGVVLDLLSFWTAWRLGVLEIMETAVGRIHVGQKVIDRLRYRREYLAPSVHEGSMHAFYEDGRVIPRVTPPEVIRAMLDDHGRAIEWIEANATVCPLVAGDDLPQAVREHIGLGSSDIYDALVVAKTRDLLLVTDDRMVRALGRIIGFPKSCWTQAVLAYARARGLMTRDRYIRCVASLIGAGHDYLSITALDLLDALDADIADGEAPGPIFKQVSGNIGGKTAEPESHVAVVVEFLRSVWSDHRFAACRKAAAAHLLRQLIRFRHDDYGVMLFNVFGRFRGESSLGQFLRYWQVGHFITDEAIYGPAAPSTAEALSPPRHIPAIPAPPRTTSQRGSSGRPAGGSARRRRRRK